MSLSIAQNIKAQIKINLQALVTAGSLGSFVAVDNGKDPLSITPPGKYPFAILSMPMITSDFEDQVTNIRTYRFDILFIQKVENLQTTSDIEGLIDAVLNQFDNHFTLAGVAQAAVLPAEVLAWPVSSGDKTFACFVATIKARALYTVIPS